MSLIVAKPELERVIRDAWIATLPDLPFDPERSWEDSGADSLKSMQFVLRLEQELGCAIPFDLISRDMTVAMLTRRLRGEDDPAAATAPNEELVRAFLFSGVHGDGPLNAEFRRALSGRVRFDVLDLGDLTQGVKVLTSIGATATVMAGRIQMMQPKGPLHLAGYSFGGLVAFETAVQLVAAGREVAFLGLLDSLPDLSTSSARSLPAGMLWAGLKPGEGERRATWLRRQAISALLATRAFPAMRRLALRTDRASGRQMSWFSQQVRLRLRWEALRHYRPRPYRGYTFLVYSDEYDRQQAVQRWAQLCADLHTVHIPGSHASLLDPDGIARMAPAFAAALDVALERRRDGQAAAPHG